MIKQEYENAKGWTRWISPTKGYRIVCCDCGLTHKIETRLQNKRIQFRAHRVKKE